MTPSPSNDHDERRRTRQNVVVLALLAVLLLAGLWLFSEIKAYLKVETCVEAGRRNCGNGE